MAFEKLLPFLILSGALVLASECDANAYEYDADTVAVARLAVNEASFAQSDDHAAIASVIARNARRRGVSPAAYVETVHRRVGATRPWVADLDATMERPESWPERDVPWEPIGQAKWSRVLATVDAVLHGRMRFRCEASTWGGRAIDAERIARMVAAGWQPVPCGFTHNVFLRRAR